MCDGGEGRARTYGAYDGKGDIFLNSACVGRTLLIRFFGSLRSYYVLRDNDGATGSLIVVNGTYGQINGLLYGNSMFGNFNSYSVLGVRKNCTIRFVKILFYELVTLTFFNSCLG